MSEKAEPMRFGWTDASPTGAHAYLVPGLSGILARRIGAPSGKRLLDVGCGNGAVTHVLSSAGFDVVGIDPARDGIEQARTAYPGLRVELGSAYDDLASRFGLFDVVVSLEVVEHLYAPHIFAENVARALRPGGLAVLSTPYHGYWKNLMLALAGKWDFHHHPNVHHGHIKFWSRRTLEQLMSEAGMHPCEFRRLGRIPALGKSMMLGFAKPRRPDEARPAETADALAAITAGSIS
jgi:2-polyprenyl-6-hydroxyphenyl methylase/3-demethylubiquinone-9 3-methyltransferase